MEDNEAVLERNGNGTTGIIIRSIGVAVMGTAISAAGWMYYKFEDNAKERDSMRQRLAKLETAVEKFHAEFYRWQEKHERVDDKQTDQISRLRRGG